MADLAIEISDISYSYALADGGQRKAIDHLSLNVEKGCFLMVIGHNGSGKSTLAKMLNGLLLPDEGTVTVMGMDTSQEEKIWDIRRQAGLVFQNPDNQMVTTIVEEDVAFGPENLGVPQPQIRERVDRALRSVGMEDFAQSAPHMLSGGQKQRIAIAGILAMEPSILILDEATAMLDPQGRKDILETVTRLKKERGMTVIWITHYMDEAVDADRIIVMDHGKIAMDGTPQEIFSNVEEMERISLDVPMAAKIAKKLKDEGFEFSRTPVKIEELAEKLCQFRS